MRERFRSPWDNDSGMVYRISHRTTYKYVSPVSVGNHVACLKPRSYAQNKLLQNTVSIHPQPVTLSETERLLRQHSSGSSRCRSRTRSWSSSR